MRWNCVSFSLVAMRLALLLLVVASIVACEGQAGELVEERAQGNGLNGASARDRFKLPKIFDFQMYKRLFHKAYGYLEEMVRRKYVLARAFRAWSSAIKYKFRQSSFYLALNHLSDRSPEELKRRLNQHAGLEPNELENLAAVGANGQAKPIGNKETMERKKRDAPQVDEVNPRELDEKKLISIGEGVQLDAETAKKVDDHPESNNPLYELGNRDIDPREGQLERVRERFIPISDGELNEPDWMDVNQASFFAARDDPSKADEVFFDHRQSSCLLLPRDQGDCGSCYAFATIAVAEWLHCKRTGKLVALSEQYLVDCGTLAGAFGCRGGNYYKMAKFIQTFGLELRSTYPYRFRADQCPYYSSVDVKSMGYIRMKLNTLLLIPLRRLEEFIPHGPMLVGISQMDGFLEYGGGIMDGSDCRVKDDHAVVLIGHGREDGREYWLMRNSYGVGWGDGGYFKLAKGSDCIHERVGMLYGTDNGRDYTHQVEKNVHNEERTIKTHYINNLIKVTAQ